MADATTGHVLDDRIAAAYAALQHVVDPEIPAVSLLEMGIIANVRVAEGTLEVDMTPTFVGCPALDLMKVEIIQAMEALGEVDPLVNVVMDPPWTTDRITEDGRRKLKEFGLAPPGQRCGGGEPQIEQVACPHCDSTNTELESIFGPTLCRSIHYCHACLQSFEHMKPV